MEDKDIQKLFESVFEGPGSTRGDVRQVFSVLVSSTLKYRDLMFENREIVVTVEDVSIALGWLVPSIETGRLPETEDKVMLGLLKIWLDELGNTSSKKWIRNKT